MISDCPYSIIVLLETWFDSTVNSAELFDLNEWIVFRCDRSDVNDNRNGGGVLIAAKSSLGPKQITVQNDASLEHVWIGFRNGDKKSYIGGYYIPPNSATDKYTAVYDQTSEVLNSANPDDDLFLVGDFNKVVDWVPDEDNEFVFHPSPTADDDALFYDSVASLGLSQICNIRSRNQLDLIFTNVSGDLQVSRASHPLKCDSYHHISIELAYTTRVYENADELGDVKLDFRRADIRGLATAIANTDWVTELSVDEPDSMAANFKDKFNNLLTEFVPQASPKRKRKYAQPWMNAETARLRNRRNRAFKAWRRSLTTTSWSIFVERRDEYARCVITTYADYLESQADVLKSDPKRFWNFVNSKRGTSGVPKHMCYNGSKSNDLKTSADLFADYFESVYQQSSDSSPTSGPFSQPIPDLTITENDIASELRSLNIHKSTGPDGIPNFILKSLATELSRPLCLIFRSSLEAGKFPSLWKSSYISPIFKSGDRSDCSNYRGIAILSAIAKLFEKLVCKHLTQHCASLIHPAQHGFRSGHSTATNLVTLTEYILNAMHNSSQVDALYTDFAKAFDHVDHNILLNKIRNFGIDGKLWSWIQSYLSGRTQIVRIGNTLSRSLDVTSGVPQGSHLGPLLFAMFINDLCDDLVGCKYLLYADDLKLYRTTDSISDALILQDNLNRVQRWCEANKMKLNVTKCEVISFSRKHQDNRCVFAYSLNGTMLKRSTTVKDLGVLLDEKLTFKQHINGIVSKANCMWGFVKRQAKDFNCPYVLKALYCALVRSRLENCSIVWSPFFECDKIRIESVQKRFLKFALNHLNWSHQFILPPYEARLYLLDLDTLGDRRRLAAASFMASCLKNDVVPPFAVPQWCPARTRHTSVPRLRLPPPTRTRYAVNAPLQRLTVEFNRYAECFDLGLSVNSFKGKIRKSMSYERKERLRLRGYI